MNYAFIFLLLSRPVSSVFGLGVYNKEQGQTYSLELIKFFWTTLRKDKFWLQLYIAPYFPLCGKESRSVHLKLKGSLSPFFYGIY